MSEETRDYATKHLVAIKDELGADFDKLTDEAKDKLKEASKLYAGIVKLQVKVTTQKALGKTPDVSDESIKESFADVESFVADWAYIGVENAKLAFWETAHKVAGVGGTVLGTLVRSAL